MAIQLCRTMDSGEPARSEVYSRGASLRRCPVLTSRPTARDSYGSEDPNTMSGKVFGLSVRLAMTEIADSEVLPQSTKSRSRDRNTDTAHGGPPSPTFQSTIARSPRWRLDLAQTEAASDLLAL